MAASSLSTDPTTQDVFSWLKTLPLAPEYHPTLSEFQDPVSYIFKIEKEASKYGICKIVPPVSPAPKKTAISNLNRSLSARSASSDPDNPNSPPTFTTRQQQIGFCPRKPQPVKKPVWQSGEYYTFQQFEAKAKNFEKSYLKKCGKRGGLSALEIETLYWKATIDKPFRVEYANDMPGSAFVPVSAKKKSREALMEGVTLGETNWNMRGVSRAKGSLLSFMKEEIPGVTSPMVYIAMLFSWFAWHVEDHDLHSLNYLHFGAGKTWYGVPRDAAVAFEEVVRIHGYGGEINPLVTFSVLGEKTTVMSPEVFISAGIPCCRLVQNAGEFVVTFPRAYHTGFSHGFNCGEAANIATPEWLRFAKDAAIRRASINYPPMVSHFQLLYDLALALCSRVPGGISAEPRSSRLKDKKKDEGETVIKEFFVQNVEHNNELLHSLGKGSSVVILPRNSSDISACSKLRFKSHLRVNPRLPLGLCRTKESVESSDLEGITQAKGFYLIKGKFSSLYERIPISLVSENDNLSCSNGRSTIRVGGLSDERLFSCVTCGILSYACVAIIQPKEQAAGYLMSADCSFFNDWVGGSVIASDGHAFTSEKSTCNGRTERSVSDGLYDVPVQSFNNQLQIKDEKFEEAPNTDGKRYNTSALSLLASTYGNSSDSEDDQAETDVALYTDDATPVNCSSEDRYEDHSLSSSGFKGDATFNCLSEFETVGGSARENGLGGDSTRMSHMAKNCAPDVDDTQKSKLGKDTVPMENKNASFVPRSDEDSSRLHVFCLEHAVEVEQQLRPIGGVHITLLCHPDYPKVEAEAKSMAEDLHINRIWNDITFRDATKDDEKRIQLALDSEEAVPGNGDWAVKLGINLFYSVNLSHSPLYSKQMPYNSVIYNAFGRNSPALSSKKTNVYQRRSSRQKRVVVGKWCGKVWMSNQVHPLLAKADPEEEEEEEEKEEEEEEDDGDHDDEHDDNKLERKSRGMNKIETSTATRKAGRKRKVVFGGWSTNRKVKHLEPDFFPDDLMENYKHTKFINRDTVSDDMAEEGDSDFGKDRASSDGSLGEHPHFWDTRISRNKQVRWNKREQDEISDDSLELDFHQQHRKTSRSKRAKWAEREDEDSDDSYQQYTRTSRNKRDKWIERKDEVSFDSLGNDSEQRNRVSRGKQAKWREREDEDALSDDLLGDDFDSHHRHGKVSKRARAKWTERENSVSDDLLEENYNSRDRHMKIPKSKQNKWTERECSVSDTLLRDDPQQNRRISRGKQAKYTETEDALSDGPLEKKSNSVQHYRRISRRKQTKFIEKENAVSEDACGDSSLLLRTKISRSKRAKFTEPEDTVSDDQMEDCSNQQAKRTLRSKKAKSNLVPKMKEKQEETSRSMKQANARLTKPKISEQMRKQTARVRTNQVKQNSRLFDSDVEEQLEGGPSTRLRKRAQKAIRQSENIQIEKNLTSKKKVKNTSVAPKLRDEEMEHMCDIDGCTMSFGSKQELVLHKKNICPVKGCGKKFFSHKYLVQHRRVHVDDRPLKCPWKGCKMSFKWAWARTEHIRVHTGARPYVCSEPGCGQTFRFVSDFSRHKRKTGHSAKKSKG